MFAVINDFALLDKSSAALHAKPRLLLEEIEQFILIKLLNGFLFNNTVFYQREIINLFSNNM
jgi:hypothetical protein